MVKIRDEKIPESELRKAKDYFIGNMYLGLESSDALANFFGFQEIFCRMAEMACRRAVYRDFFHFFYSSFFMNMHCFPGRFIKKEE